MDKQSAYLQLMGIQTWEDQSKPMATGEGSDESFWQNLQQTVANCQLCSLHKTRKQAVFGVGDVDADLVIVGEAPGANEDRQGEPFVGRAGQLLNLMLEAIDLHREQVFIGNVLKCRPPQNRDPSPAEVKCCTPYLEQQLGFLKPKVILAVGRIAAHYLLGIERPLSRLRGQQFSFGEHNIPLIITYHPAYLLRNPRDKRKAYNDLQLINKLLAGA